MDSAATLTGIVSDSFSGNHHYMLSGANDTECARYCIAHQGRMQGLQVYKMKVCH